MKIFSSIFCFLLFFTVSSSSLVFAQDVTPTPFDESSAASESAVQKTEYNLPYPGILPDNPLHIIKATRDKIVALLINDPIKKAEFNLLTSDKRVYAAQLLSQKNKGDITIDTLSKSNNYFHESVAATEEAKSMGKNVDIVLHNLKLSGDKHLEVIEIIKSNLKNDFLEQLRAEEKRLVDFNKTVEKMSPGK